MAFHPNHLPTQPNAWAVTSNFSKLNFWGEYNRTNLLANLNRKKTYLGEVWQPITIQTLELGAKDHKWHEGFFMGTF